MNDEELDLKKVKGPQPVNVLKPGVYSIPGKDFSHFRFYLLSQQFWDEQTMGGKITTSDRTRVSENEEN